MNSFLKTLSHENSLNWPWSKFSPISPVNLLVQKNIMHIRNFFSDKHYHLYVKYGVVKSIIEWNNVDKWKKIYDKMQINRTWQSKFNNFCQLIENIYTNWYDSSVTIPVDPNNFILDWSHRLAILAYMWINPSIEVLNYESHNYDYNWFIAQNFTSIELWLIKEIKTDFNSLYCVESVSDFFGVIWGSTITNLGTWDNIIDLIWVDNLSNFLIKYYGERLLDVIKLTYFNDWIEEERLKKKSEWISSRSDWLVWFILIKWKTLDEVKELKNNIRSKIIQSLDDYLFDSIMHVIDDVWFTTKYIRNKLEI